MSFLEYLSTNYGALMELAVEHATIVAVSVGIALVVSLALGILAHRVPALSSAILNTTSVFLTIPSLALFALAIPIFGLGFKPTVAALVLYALLPIVRNTVSGLTGVDPAIVESAKGMGMGAARRLLQIELPLAWPVILTGIRVSAQLTVGIAAIAALVGGPGLGTEIFRGIRSLGSPFAPNLVYGGTLAIIALAAVLDAVFFLIGRLTTSRGIRD